MIVEGTLSERRTVQYCPSILYIIEHILLGTILSWQGIHWMICLFCLYLLCFCVENYQFLHSILLGCQRVSAIHIDQYKINSICSTSCTEIIEYSKNSLKVLRSLSLRILVIKASCLLSKQDLNYIGKISRFCRTLIQNCLELWIFY